jgi:arginine deiminase
MNASVVAAAYGGAGWSPRRASLQNEIGRLWGPCGLTTECAALKSVLLHRPGVELDALEDPEAAQMLAALDIARARTQHDALAEAYRRAGVVVHFVAPAEPPPPNLMFVADLLFMTAEGAIVGRPASTVRAGEERWIARRLAELGIPILRCIRGTGTFEGADAMWIDPETVLLAEGLRTNREGADQVTNTLKEMGINTVRVGLPFGAMHLMGTLRILDRDLAAVWPGRVPYAAVQALRARGFSLVLAPDETELKQGMALNVVTLRPREVLMAAGNPLTQALFQDAGVVCQTIQVAELIKAAGGVGCLTGVLERERV